jgi:hypothetical protein
MRSATSWPRYRVVAPSTQVGTATRGYQSVTRKRGHNAFAPAVIFDFESRALDREFVDDAAYIHLEIEALHRRAREMPGQTARGGCAADDLVGEERMDVKDRIDLGRGHVRPAEAERRHAQLYRSEASNPQSAKAGVPGFEALLLTFASVRRNQSRLVQLLKTILETADANVVAPVQWIEPHNSGTRMVHPRHIRRILSPGSGR